MHQEQTRVGDFIIEKQIGQGAFSEVFLAKSVSTQKYFALKKINKEKYEKLELSSNLNEEVKIMKFLKHPNILNLFDIINNAQGCYLILEYCSQGDLGKFVKNQKLGRLTEQDATQIIIQLIDAMNEIHQQGISHRDLKLENILINEEFQIKVADFGFAKFIGESLFQTICGTPITMAPERLRGKPYSEKADIWSFGIVIYQIVFGRPPYFPNDGQAKNLIKEILQKELTFPEKIPISEDLKDLLKKMIKIEPNERLNFKELLEQPWVIQNNNKNSQKVTEVIRSLSEKEQSIDSENDENQFEINQIIQSLEFSFIPYLKVKQLITSLSEINQIYQKITNKFLEELRNIETIYITLENQQSQLTFTFPEKEFKYTDFKDTIYTLILELIQIYIKNNLDNDQDDQQLFKVIENIWSIWTVNQGLSNQIKINCNIQDLNEVANSLRKFSFEQTETNILKFSSKKTENFYQVHLKFDQKVQRESFEIQLISDFLNQNQF